MGIPNTVTLTGKIAPTSEIDTYPVTDPQYGLGGLRSVGSTADRNAIPQERREEGMMVYVRDTDAFYALIGGTADTNWILFTPSGLGPQGPTGPTGSPGTEVLLIDTFSTTIDDIVMKGNVNHSLAGESISVAYASGVVPVTGAIYLTDPTKGTGFPVYFPTAAMDSITFTNQTITAGVGESVTMRLVVTGNGLAGDTLDFSVAIGNEIRWGESTLTSLDGSQVQSVLTNYKLTSNTTGSFPHDTKVDMGNDEYAYYAYPLRLGQVMQSLNNSAYGGIHYQGEYTIPGDPSVVSTNSLGFAEPYYVLRTSQRSLGATHINTIAK